MSGCMLVNGFDNRSTPEGRALLPMILDTVINTASGLWYVVCGMYNAQSVVQEHTITGKGCF